MSDQVKITPQVGDIWELFCENETITTEELIHAGDSFFCWVKSKKGTYDWAHKRQLKELLTRNGREVRRFNPEKVEWPEWADAAVISLSGKICFCDFVTGRSEPLEDGCCYAYQLREEFDRPKPEQKSELVEGRQYWLKSVDYFVLLMAIDENKIHQFKRLDNGGGYQLSAKKLSDKLDLNRDWWAEEAVGKFYIHEGVSRLIVQQITKTLRENPDGRKIESGEITLYGSREEAEFYLRFQEKCEGKWVIESGTVEQLCAEVLDWESMETYMNEYTLYDSEEGAEKANTDKCNCGEVVHVTEIGHCEEQGCKKAICGECQKEAPDDDGDLYLRCPGCEEEEEKAIKEDAEPDKNIQFAVGMKLKLLKDKRLPGGTGERKAGEEYEVNEIEGDRIHISLPGRHGGATNSTAAMWEEYYDWRVVSTPDPQPSKSKQEEPQDQFVGLISNEEATINLDDFLEKERGPRSYGEIQLFRTTCGRHFLGYCRGGEWRYKVSFDGETAPLPAGIEVTGWVHLGSQSSKSEQEPAEKEVSQSSAGQGKLKAEANVAIDSILKGDLRDRIQSQWPGKRVEMLERAVLSGYLTFDPGGDLLKEHIFAMSAKGFAGYVYDMGMIDTGKLDLNSDPCFPLMSGKMIFPVAVLFDREGES